MNNMSKYIKRDRYMIDLRFGDCLEIMKDRENKFTHEAAKDIHERDKNHLIDAYNAACDVAKDYGWFTIECVKDGKIRTIEDIHEEIYKELKNKL